MGGRLKYEDYQLRGWHAVDYEALSQWQRARGILIDWRKAAPDRGVYFAAVWDADDLENDYVRPDDWWHVRHWRLGIWQCQNYHHIDIGPVSFLVAT